MPATTDEAQGLRSRVCSASLTAKPTEEAPRVLSKRDSISKAACVPGSGDELPFRVD